MTQVPGFLDATGWRFGSAENRGEVRVTAAGDAQQKSRAQGLAGVKEGGADQKCRIKPVWAALQERYWPGFGARTRIGPRGVLRNSGNHQPSCRREGLGLRRKAEAWTVVWAEGWCAGDTGHFLPHPSSSTRLSVLCFLPLNVSPLVSLSVLSVVTGCKWCIST